MSKNKLNKSEPQLDNVDSNLNDEEIDLRSDIPNNRIAERYNPFSEGLPQNPPNGLYKGIEIKTLWENFDMLLLNEVITPERCYNWKRQTVGLNPIKGYSTGSKMSPAIAKNLGECLDMVYNVGLESEAWIDTRKRAKLGFKPIPPTQ